VFLSGNNNNTTIGHSTWESSVAGGIW